MGHNGMSDVMQRRRLQVLCAMLIAVSCGGAARADEALDREYRIKAAFVYNFLKFVEGGRFAPARVKNKDEADPNNPLVIGVLGVPPSRVAFEEFKGKQIGSRPLAVRWFQGFEELADKDKNIPERHPDLDRIKVCHVLFLCSSERAFLPRILPHLQQSGMLTVGDVPLFLEAGGTINLLIEEKKVRFEINLAAAARARLVIRSSLLRLAVRTIEHDPFELKKDEEGPGGAGRP